MAYRQRRKKSRMDRIVKFTASIIVLVMIGGILISLFSTIPFIKEVFNL